ncbi:bifunctional diaminohydroxyphosphoribosylaminopyrimidine deaminase/5-amino-6-(5-phosphoribosylamino)uracil reductase RibD [Pseudovibrio exalbescens]|uniref:bifunctional diaminohydroxyphosphoribosylaminopyrimidine deaminase/5-amino-6-(5-phosphoribosylamino)uracil reductase RibD n=1 Tax=Pseudovibrio exalbescens TaxID=197461 RepID=UPI001AD94BA8|nr:bifunctional diaminohydroxyphosphoribosylaminopyrimidine deaminase/5-amino-6-(5-phosphoribosylamino)uracil reductase RibD [Pseudovibrio exalbescens]
MPVAASGPATTGDPKQREVDERFMAAALSFAQRAQGRTWPNPPVGALIVRQQEGQSVIVGQGATMPPGGPHAEVQALRQAGERARGATAYVTLEPCAHHGRTGPCAVALAEAGIARVVYGLTDPNPLVAGSGREILEDHGIDVVQGVLEPQCRQAVQGHLARIEKGRPHLLLKMAISHNGFIGQTGEGQLAISSSLSKRLVHGVRARMDGILVGIGTVLEDDPELTCRLPGMISHSPVRIVMDSRARLPLNSKLVKSCQDVPVWLLAGEDAEEDRVSALERCGVTVISSNCLRDGHVCLDTVLSALYMRGLSQVMVEGGAHIARAMLDENVIDEALIFKGQGTVTASGLRPFLSEGIEALDRSRRFIRRVERHSDGDTVLHYGRIEEFV